MLEAVKVLKAKQDDVSPLIKLALEVGPLTVFFLANAKAGIFWATGLFMVATAIALLASRILLKRVPILALFTGVFVMVFGFLTIALHDDTFIKVKPTIVNLLLASIMAAGLYFRRPILRLALGHVMQLTEEGWRILTIRWIGFFIVLAILNEIVWRNFSTDSWVQFKWFGVMPLTFLFMMAQVALITKYQVEEPETKVNAPANSD